MAAAPRTLDVKEPQILRHIPADPMFRWHHRLLLKKITAGRWIAISPDHDFEVVDLNTVAHVVLERRS